MAYAHSTTNSSSAAHGSFMDRIARVIGALQEAYRRRALFIATCNELAHLSDRDLADIGIHRSMIGRIARDAAYSK